MTGRLALSIAGAMALIVGVVLAGAPPSTVGNPPSTQVSISPEAFRPVTVPERVDEPDPTPSPILTPKPGEGLASDLDEIRPDPLRADHPEAELSATVTPQPSPPGGPIHLVRPGDNLWLIAAWHEVDLEPILTWNPGVDPRRLVAGQEILVPGGAPMPPNAVPPTPRPARAPAAESIPGPATAGAAGGGGDHLWPLPVRGIITTRFSRGHPGIDIAVPAGTPVGAIADGTVTFAGWKNNGGGYVVEVRHPNGMTSTYNHNREITVTVGQDVVAGEQIASVGSTGNSTGPHLDLRVEMGGRLLNPLQLDW